MRETQRTLALDIREDLDSAGSFIAYELNDLRPRPRSPQLASQGVVNIGGFPGDILFAINQCMDGFEVRVLYQSRYDDRKVDAFVKEWLAMWAEGSKNEC